MHVPLSEYSFAASPRKALDGVPCFMLRAWHTLSCPPTRSQLGSIVVRVYCCDDSLRRATAPMVERELGFAHVRGCI
jgi:hypothetical protein